MVLPLLPKTKEGRYPDNITDIVQIDYYPYSRSFLKLFVCFQIFKALALGWDDFSKNGNKLLPFGFQLRNIFSSHLSQKTVVMTDDSKFIISKMSNYLNDLKIDGLVCNAIL